MNNHNYHGNKNPIECPTCKSAMTVSDNENFLICDSLTCNEEIELNLGEDDE